MNFRMNMESQRLFGAAVLLLKAIQSKQGMKSLVTIHLDGPPADAPASSRRYTLMELVEAMTMLIRMGFVPAHKRARDAGHDGGNCGLPPNLVNHVRLKRQSAPNDESRRNHSGASQPRDWTLSMRIISAAYGATMN